jgi:hypothetical protein
LRKAYFFAGGGEPSPAGTPVAGAAAGVAPALAAAVAASLAAPVSVAAASAAGVAAASIPPTASSAGISTLSGDAASLALSELPQAASAKLAERRVAKANFFMDNLSAAAKGKALRILHPFTPMRAECQPQTTIVPPLRMRG